jgi:cell division protease FtsH
MNHSGAQDAAQALREGTECASMSEEEPKTGGEGGGGGELRDCEDSGSSQLGPPAGKGARARGSRRPRGLYLVAALLAVLLAIAAFSSLGSDERSVISNFYQAQKLLLEDWIDPDSLVFVKDKKLLQAKLRRPGHSGATRVAVEFATDDEVNRFRKEALEVYNEKYGVTLDWKVKDPFFWQFLIQPLIWVAVIVLLYFLFMRQLRAPGAGGNILTFGKTHAKVAARDGSRVTFDDVAGIKEAKQEVVEVIEFLRNPKRFQNLGGRIPRGIMLVGSPGTGKTLLAKAIAGEAEVPFFSICGSDFVEMFVGVGASRVRDLFKQAKESSPCIIFLDEVDAVGRRRGSGLGGGHDEREQTLNAILVEMDGFDSDEGIILIAATNRPDVLDPALLRPGRFDREITIDLPDLAGREEILRVHGRKVKLDAGVDLHRIARATPGFSGAELAAVVNEAAIIAAMRNQQSILEVDLEEARDKIRWGRQKANPGMDEEDRTITAYHEAGHALAAHLLPEAEPVHKVTIIPRGMSLGSTMQLPERDRYHLSRAQLLGNLVVLYAGRAAEQLCCKDITAGAKSDIERATELARRMVCEWGMSEALGPINYTESEETLFLGREVTRTRNHSELLAQKIDEEVERLVQKSYDTALDLLRRHRQGLERIARALLERETLSGEDVAALVDGREGWREGGGVSQPKEDSTG